MRKTEMKENRKSEKIVAMNPMGYPPTITQLEMAPRLDSLDGKTVYLVDVRFDDGDILLQQMQIWFTEHKPKVKTVFVRKSGVYTQDDAKLFQEIKEKADAVILGIGH
ncbi:YvcK family protein [Candidatus Poribacteria bacterium]|nr:YvcK family protein [Candidatus Poribacteria bacterium]